MEWLATGFILRGRGAAYATSWGDTDFFKILEAQRPSHCLAHTDAVFAVGHPNDIDLAGSGTEWAFELEPIGPVTQHDLNWSSEISMLLSDGYAPASAQVLSAAANYWAGLPHTNESVWEYLMKEAKIIQSCRYDDFELDLPKTSVFSDGKDTQRG